MLIAGYALAETLAQTLKQCGDDRRGSQHHDAPSENEGGVIEARRSQETPLTCGDPNRLKVVAGSSAAFFF
ncbi:hypothetical protein [Bradyrhizobium liaoningense]|uniref:hypothetical protein n=1 Tax=Bradyrhizobium liaoningense TaxID=43992 RepID=UPI001BAACEBD|nr:hypothetical protein [Bradyrhizobium liaoningense]MBR0859123.1 hypothetical protein [Bradyrhizobium liaoningense]